jgi:hypothetical protein
MEKKYGEDAVRHQDGGPPSPDPRRVVRVGQGPGEIQPLIRIRANMSEKEGFTIDNPSKRKKAKKGQGGKDILIIS